MLLGIVQRIDAARFAFGDAALVRARAPGATHHLLLVTTRARLRVALVEGDALVTARASMRVDRHPQETTWRTHLEGARVLAIVERGVRFERESMTETLARDGARLVLRASAADDGEVIDILALDGASLVAELATATFDGQRAALARAITRAIAKVDRRIEAIRGDLGRIAKTEETATRARLFVAEAARVPRGARSMSIVDWSSGESMTVEMPLDPARSAREQLEAIFKRARRLKDGARFGATRLADAERAMSALRAVATELSTAENLAALDALTLRAREAAPRDFRAPSSSDAPASAKRAQAPLPSYRTFRGANAMRILVGRGAAHNDDLTFHVAKPHDLWLHAKGHAGAHVVVPLAKGASCPPDVLADAAHLAAHFSKAKDETTVEISYSPRRYLRKPRGSAPGLVVVDREKVIVLRRQDDRLRVLLESEASPHDE